MILFNKLGFIAHAQTPPVIPPEMKMSATPNPVGSGARAMGMGGAFISVADDATAASWNPAGLINLKRPEVSIVGSFFSGKKNYDTTGISGEINDLSDDQFRLNYLSGAIPFFFLSRVIVFSLNYQHLYEFSEEKSLQWSYAFEDISTEKTKTSHVKQKGSLGPLSPAIAVQVAPSLYIGATGNFWIKDFFNNYWENIKTVRDEGIELGERKNSFAELYERYDFSGFNLHLGFLWRLNQSIRIGGVLKTPFKARVNYKSRYVSHVEYPDDPTEYEYTPPFSEEEIFKLKMPMSYGIGATLSFLEDFLLISFDIYRTEWNDFLMYTDSGEFSPINIGFDHESNIKPTTQIRFGTEYLWLRKRYVFPIRTGIFYDPQPAEGRVDDFYGISIGTGIIFKDFAFDIAYQYRFGKNRKAETMLGHKISANDREHYLYWSVIVYF